MYDNDSFRPSQTKQNTKKQKPLASGTSEYRILEDIDTQEPETLS